MKVRDVVVMLALAAAPVTQVSAELLYEPFNYTAGDALGGKVASNTRSWEITGSGDDITVESPGMVTQLVPDGSGTNGVTFGGAGQTDRIAINSDDTSLTSGLVYYSLKFRFDDMGTTLDNGTGVFFAGFNNVVGPQTGQPGVVASRLRASPDDSTVATNDYKIGIQPNGGSNTFDSGGHLFGDEVFVVSEYDIDNLTSRLWINPDPNTFGAASAPGGSLFASGGAAPTGGIATFLLRQNAILGTVHVDELRVDTTWAGVTPVPEPTGLTVLAVFATPLLMRRRKSPRIA